MLKSTPVAEKFHPCFCAIFAQKFHAQVKKLNNYI